MPSAALIRNLMRSGYASVVSDKLLSRVSESANRMRSHTSAGAWAQREAKDVTALLAALDADLWAESQVFAAAFEPEAQRRLSALGLPLGGAGHYPLLYFLSRLRRPTVVVETGVAAGRSSIAVLEALEVNRGDTLHPSDFPLVNDVQDNRHFRYSVTGHKGKYWIVAFADKFVGLTGPGFAELYARRGAGESG